MKGKVWKRLIASALTVAIMFTSNDIAFAAGTEIGLKHQDHVADMLQREYSGTLSQTEFDILKHPAIAGSQYVEFAGLPEGAALDISATKSEGVTKVTVTAGSYDAGNGYVWEPVAGTFQDGSAEAKAFTLNYSDGKWSAELAPTQDSYRIDVEYGIPVITSPATQEAMLELPAKMYKDIKHLETHQSLANNVSKVAKDYANLIEIFVSSCSDAGKEAWNKVKAWNESDVLNTYINDYCMVDGEFAVSGLRTVIDVGGESITVGEAMNREAEEINGYFDILMAEPALVIASSYFDTVKSYINTSDWNMLNDSLFVANVTADNFAAAVQAADGTSGNFDQLVMRAYRDSGKKGPADVTAKTAKMYHVFAEKEILSQQTEMQSAALHVVANVVQNNKLVEKVNVSYTNSFPSGTTKADVEAWIAESFENAKEVHFDDSYKIDIEGTLTSYYDSKSNYDAIINSIPETMTGALEYTLEITPVKCDVNYEYDASKNTQVYAGSTITLDSTAESGKAYIYNVNGEEFVQGSKIVVWDSVEITRRQTNAMKFNELVYENLDELGLSNLTADQEKILQYVLKNGVYQTANGTTVDLTDTIFSGSLYIQAPQDSDELVSIEHGDGVMTVTAQTKEAGIEGLYWEPVSMEVKFGNGVASANHDFGAVANGAASATVPTKSGTRSYTSIDVAYKLTITPGADTFAAGDVEAAVNLPNTLVEDTKEVLEVLELLVDNYSNLEKANASILSMLGKNETTGKEVNPEVTKVIKHLFSARYTGADGKNYGYFDSNNNYLQLYQELGVLNKDTGVERVIAYYTNSNTVKNIEMQLIGDGTSIYDPETRTVTIPNGSFVGLAEVLNTLVQYEDDIKKFMDSMQAGASSQFEAIKKLSDELNKITEMPKKHEDLNTNAGGFNALCEILVGCIGTDHAEKYTITGPEQLLAEATVNKVAPDRVKGTVSFQVNKSYDELNPAVTSAPVPESLEPTFSIIDGLTEPDLINWLSGTGDGSAYASLVSQFSGLENCYDLVITLNGEECTQEEIAAKITGIREGVAIVYTWEPKAFRYQVTGGEAKTIYFDGSRVISLEPNPDADYERIYTFAGKEYSEVSSENDMINIDLRNLSASEFAALFANGPVVITVRERDIKAEAVKAFVNEMNKALDEAGLSSAAAFKLYTKEGTDAEYSIVLRIGADVSGVTSNITTVANVMMNNVFTKIGIGAEDDAIMTKTEGAFQIYMQPFLDALLSSGKDKQYLLDHISEDGMVVNDTGIVNGYNYIGTVIDDGIIGTVLAEDVINFTTAAGSPRTYDFYITIADINGKNQAKLASLHRELDALGTTDFVLENEAINVTNTLSDEAYAYYLRTMLLMGKADLSDTSDIDPSLLFDYEKGIFKDVLNESVTAQTLQNTFDDLNMSIDVLGQKDDVNASLENLRKFMAMTESHGAVTVEGDRLYAYNMKYDLHKTLEEKLGDKYEAFGGYFGDANLCFDITADIENAEYDALILEKDAAKVVTGAEEISKAPADSEVILLSDVSGDITLSSVYLDLNGKTINGNITAEDGVVIGDSSLDTRKAGTVTGTLEGDLDIYAGIYPGADVSSYLPARYIEENDIVRNELYTIASAKENGTETITVTLADKDEDIDYDALFLDVVYELGLDFYAAAGVKADDDTIFSARKATLYRELGYRDDYSINKHFNGLGTMENATIDYSGLSSFVSGALSKLTDLDTLAQNLADKKISEHTLAINGWKINSRLEGRDQDNYIAYRIEAGTDTVETRKLVFAVEETAAQEKAEEAAKLADILTVEDISLNIERIEMINEVAGVEKNGTLKETLNLNTEEWVLFLGKFLAANTEDADVETALNTAIAAYDKNGSLAELQAAMEAMSLDEMNTILRAAGSMEVTEIAGYASETEEAAEGKWPVRDYAEIIKKLGKTLVKEQISLEGTLGDKAKADEDGAYYFELTYDVYETEVTLNLFNIVKEPEPTPTPTPEPTVKPRPTPTPAPSQSSGSGVISITPVVHLGNVISGYVIDNQNRTIKLDVVDTGMTVEQFNTLATVTFSVTSGSVRSVEFLGGVEEYRGRQLVANGAQVRVTAANGSGSVSVDYTLIMMGDVNCNGRTDSNDTLLMSKHFVGTEALTGVKLLAADMNQNGKVDSNDALLSNKKFVQEDSEYVSGLANNR